jgi:hypothetical protein
MAPGTESQSIRIRASHIRQNLLSHNNSEYFRNVLADVPDSELVRRDIEHHERKVAWLKEKHIPTKDSGRASA